MSRREGGHAGSAQTQKTHQTQPAQRRSRPTAQCRFCRFRRSGRAVAPVTTDANEPQPVPSVGTHLGCRMVAAGRLREEAGAGFPCKWLVGAPGFEPGTSSLSGRWTCHRLRGRDRPLESLDLQRLLLIRRHYADATRDRSAPQGVHELVGEPPSESRDLSVDHVPGCRSMCS